MKPSKFFLALVFAAASALAAAQPGNPQGGGEAGPVMDGNGGSDMDQGMGSGGGQHPHGPPPQAIAACKEKSSGASCSFVGRENQSRSGTCFAPPGGNHPLACRPVRAAKDARGQGMGGQGS